MLCREDVEGYEGPWPQRIYLAMGGKEYSGTRPEPGPKWDQLMVSYCGELAAVLQGKGLGEGRLEWEVRTHAFFFLAMRVCSGGWL